MSRPSQFIFSAVAAAILLSFTSCSTPYRRMYSPRKSYFVPTPEKKEKSASELIDLTAPQQTTAPSGLPESVAPGTVPGLPPATAPAPAPAPDAAPPAVPPAQ